MKTAEPIEMLLGEGLISVGPRNQGRQDCTRATRDDKTAMRPVAKLPRTLVLHREKSRM